MTGVEIINVALSVGLGGYIALLMMLGYMCGRL